MDIYRKATDACRATTNARFNQTELTGLAEKLGVLARLNLGQEQPAGDDMISRNMRALKRASDSLVIKAAKFVISYASNPYLLQLLWASTAAKETRKFDGEVQELLERFERHRITVAQEVAPAPAATLQLPTPRGATLWGRFPSAMLAAHSLRPIVVINNTTNTFVASNVGNQSTLTMENVGNSNTSTTHVRGDMENTYHSDVVHKDS